MTQAVKLKAKDFKSGVKPIWCPGCGHFSVFNAITKAMAALEISKPININSGPTQVNHK